MTRTLEKLKTEIEELYGLEFVIEGTGARLVLAYYTPTGKRLFEFTVFDNAGRWMFGGTSMAGYAQWDELCRL